MYENGLYCYYLASYLGKYSECMTGENYKLFLADPSNSGKTALVYVSPANLISNILVNSDGTPAIGLLIIPDYKLGAESIITGTLGTNGISKIKAYLNNGGKIFASGKSGYLLEKMEILPSLYNGGSKTLFSSQETSTAKYTGCSDTLNADATDPDVDYNKQLLCMNFTGNTYVLSSFLMSPTNKD